MKEKILALLLDAHPGVRRDGLMALARSLALQCTNEKEAKDLVDKITDAQVNEFIKDYRAEVDREVSESNRTFESNLRKKYDFTEKKNPEHQESALDEKKKLKNLGDGNKEKDDIAALIKAAISEAVSPLQTKLESYEKNEIAKGRLQKLSQKLSSCKDENFKTQVLKDFERMSFSSDDEFNEYLHEKETAIATANQNKVDNDLSNSGGSPLFAKKEESGISKSVADFISNQTSTNNPFVGKNV